MAPNPSSSPPSARVEGSALSAMGTWSAVIVDVAGAATAAAADASSSSARRSCGIPACIAAADCDLGDGTGVWRTVSRPRQSRSRGSRGSGQDKTKPETCAQNENLSEDRSLSVQGTDAAAWRAGSAPGALGGTLGGTLAPPRVPGP